MMVNVLIIITTLCACVAVYQYYRAQSRYEEPTYLANVTRISLFFEELQSFDDYITWVQVREIKSRYTDLGIFFKGKSNYYKKEEAVEKFNDIFDNFDAYVANYNRSYVITQKEKLNDYFDDIEGKKLDDQQRTAVVTDEYSNLIVAGAGSGKTLTILGKVLYLVQQKNIDPKDILLLSFTKQTVEDLNVRIRDLGLKAEAFTFHKLGYDIIRNYIPNQQTPIVTNENTLSNVIKTYLREDIFLNEKAMQAFVQYVACYMNIPEDFDEYDSLGEKIDVEKGIDFQTLKSKCDELNRTAIQKLDTIQGEKVKSVEELMIANFFYLNGINYEYEKRYPFVDVVYRPDFYLSDYDIYIEHFGIDKDNRAKWLTPHNEQEYLKGMEVKRENHRQNNTKLLETYSYYNSDNELLKKLEKKLLAEGVVFKPRNATEIFDKIVQNNAGFGKEMHKLIEGFVNLSKSRRLNQTALKELFLDRSKTTNSFMYERQEMFLQFALPILEKYNRELENVNQIDFNDMINLATDLVIENQPAYSYKYIIVDEYQDISVARFNLIKEIRDLCTARLVCVGDDWQSIYRFAGSDISLFSNFGKHVGKYEQLLIEQTYRNAQSLIDITAKYIQKNPKQISKSPKSKKQLLEDPIKFVRYKQDEIVEVFINEIEGLAMGSESCSILVLGRHKFDVGGLIKNSEKIEYRKRTNELKVEGFDHLDIKFLTVHKSKGTEADHVIVLNVANHLLGFPNKMADDPILSVLLSDDEEYRYAEERRLFYVALTRTKNKVVLLVPQDESLFVEEIAADNNYLLSSTEGTIHKTNCPYCQTGKLVIRQNTKNNNQFLGCSHYPTCNQTFNNIEILDETILCSTCKSGFMVKRTGLYGEFLGCTNYPKCRCIVKL